jgi:hypothetical protein
VTTAASTGGVASSTGTRESACPSEYQRVHMDETEVRSASQKASAFRPLCVCACVRARARAREGGRGDLVPSPECL